MREHFPNLRMSRFPTRCETLDFEKDILPAEQRLINEFGFLKQEINIIMKSRPSFILFEHENPKDGGLSTMVSFFVDQKNFDLDVVRTLILRRPSLLSKKEADFHNFFSLMEKHGMTEDEIIKALIEAPKVMQTNIEHQMKEIFFLFNLYHGIKEQDVMDIFRNFPYLFCCEVTKVKKFMGEFKKYRFTQEQLIRLVSFN